MQRLTHAVAVGGAAFVVTLVLGIGRGMLTGVFMPFVALLFIAVMVFLTGAVLDAILYKNPAPPAAPRVPSSARGVPAAEGPIVGPATTAIVFRQHIPPRHDPRHLSYFGGLPMVPPDFAWPTWHHAGAEEPLHFILQVDCAAMPPVAHQQGFPAQGILAVFLDLRWGHSNGFRVLHLGPVTDDFAPAQPPAALAAAYGAEARYAWRWTEALDDPASRCPRLLPRWTFDPVAIAIPSGSGVWWPADAVTEPLLLEAQEAVGKSVVESGMPGFTRPFADWPQDWRAVEIAAALLLGTGQRFFPRGAGDPRLRALSADERQAMADRLDREARDWLAQAAAQPPFAAPPQQTRDAFWLWLENWRDFAIYMIKDAAVLSIEATLAEAAARLPAEAIARIHPRHALAARTGSGIFAPTPDRMLAPPSYVQGNEEETAQTHLLLLELSSNEGLGHHFGEGVYQFWITPEDLHGRRFDRVKLTTTAY